MKLLYLIHCLFIILASTLPTTTGVSIGHYDKLGHLLAYIVLSLLSSLAFNNATLKKKMALFGFTLGACLEVVQYFVPGRSMSLADGIFNTLGILSGLLIYKFIGTSIENRLSHFKSYFQK